MTDREFDPKPRANHDKYLAVLHRMTPQQRLQKAFELSEETKRLFLIGLKQRFPEKSPEEIRQIYLARLEKCHNRNY